MGMILEPVKRATEHLGPGLSPAIAGSRAFVITRSWGLRPRLYAVARFASFASACFAG